MNYSNLDCRLPQKGLFTPEKMRDLRRRILRRLEAERVAEELKSRMASRGTTPTHR